MTSRVFAACLLALLSIGWANLVVAQLASDGAEGHLRQTIDAVLLQADQSSDHQALAKSVRPMLEQRVGFATMTKRAIGPGWRQFNSQQQAQAIDLFTTLIIRSYASKFTPGEHPEITYRGAQGKETNRTEVATTLVYRGTRYAVSYRLEVEGGWKITDVSIEGVSLVANYRSQLDAAFRSGGAQAVLEALKKTATNNP